MDLLRSESMQLVQVIIPIESSHRAISYLGDLGLFQFKDVSIFRHKIFSLFVKCGSFFDDDIISVFKRFRALSLGLLLLVRFIIYVNLVELVSYIDLASAFFIFIFLVESFCSLNNVRKLRKMI